MRRDSGVRVRPPADIPSRLRGPTRSRPWAEQLVLFLSPDTGACSCQTKPVLSPLSPLYCSGDGRPYFEWVLGYGPCAVEVNSLHEALLPGAALRTALQHVLEAWHAPHARGAAGQSRVNWARAAVLTAIKDGTFLLAEKSAVQMRRMLPGVVHPESLSHHYRTAVASVTGMLPDEEEPLPEIEVLALFLGKELL